MAPCPEPMIPRLRPLLLKCLLLAVCFHAVIGVTLHEAHHLLAMLSSPAQVVQQQGLPESVPDAGQGIARADTSARSDAEHGHYHGIDSLCTWCAAFATHLAPEQASASLAPAPLVGTVRHSHSRTALPAQPARWAFGNRDPPALQG